MTDNEKVLTVLTAHEGEWVEALYLRTHTMVHSRISDLRRKGHDIECRCFGRGDFRYRLLPKSGLRVGAAGQMEAVLT